VGGQKVIRPRFKNINEEVFLGDKGPDCFFITTAASMLTLHCLIWMEDGVVHITLPHSKDDAYVVGGELGAILALDMAGVSVDGHGTVDPLNEITAVLQIPLEGGKTPEHIKLHNGSCTPEDQNIQMT
jgi:hypothetical protein